MSDDIAAMVRELKDRQEIYDCIMRYSRGIDRLDREMLLSAYHEDAIDDHGDTYIGGVEGFADAVFELHGTYQEFTQHHITNHRCDLDGDVAHTESYYLFRCINKEAPWYNTASGRYLDRFERRDGRWAIAERICLVEAQDEIWGPNGNDGSSKYVPASRSKDDASYQRPLTVDRSRMGNG
ncbi:MAG: nuclear transport factor 2 family protein [Novosphingobium sp.]|nr:nuclear transport factor 2 family protein [Novosphingobium sp.]